MTRALKSIMRLKVFKKKKVQFLKLTFKVNKRNLLQLKEGEKVL